MVERAAMATRTTTAAPAIMAIRAITAAQMAAERVGILVPVTAAAPVVLVGAAVPVGTGAPAAPAEAAASKRCAPQDNAVLQDAWRHFIK
jgi:hypothetical protein